MNFFDFGLGTEFSSLFRSVDMLLNGFNLENTLSDISQNSFPPTDVYVDNKSKAYVIEMALAGYSKDDFVVTFEDGYIAIKINAKKKSEDRKYLQQGIKAGQALQKVKLDLRHFDVEQASSEFSNGLLRVIVPPYSEKHDKVAEIDKQIAELTKKKDALIKGRLNFTKKL